MLSNNFGRTVLLRLASIAVLMITLYVDVEDRCNDNKDTCCQQVSVHFQNSVVYG